MINEEILIIILLNFILIIIAEELSLLFPRFISI
jgi:hypothetical protein